MCVHLCTCLASAKTPSGSYSPGLSGAGLGAGFVAFAKFHLSRASIPQHCEGHKPLACILKFEKDYADTVCKRLPIACTVSRR